MARYLRRTLPPAFVAGLHLATTADSAPPSLHRIKFSRARCVKLSMCLCVCVLTKGCGVQEWWEGAGCNGRTQHASTWSESNGSYSRHRWSARFRRRWPEPTWGPGCGWWHEGHAGRPPFLGHEPAPH